MYERDSDNFDIFIFYTKLPPQDREECEIFITPEKILKINYGDYTAVNDVNRKVEYLRKLPIKELRDNLESREGWPFYTFFSRVVDAIKEYLELRPLVIEKYPEHMI